MPEGPVCIQEVHAVNEGSRALEPKLEPRSTLRHVFLVGGLALFAILVWKSSPDLIGGILLMCLAAAGLLVWLRMGLFRPLVWLSRRLSLLTTFLDRHEQSLLSTDRILREYLGERKRFCLSWLGYFLGWVAGALEAWLL